LKTENQNQAPKFPSIHQQEERYKLIVLTVYGLISSHDVLGDLILYKYRNYCFYINASRLYDDDLLGTNVYYIKFVRSMNGGAKFIFSEKGKIIVV
jgi:hypothetical protein